MISLNSNDTQQVNGLGIDISEIENQLDLLKKGATPIFLIAAAKLNHGILKLNNKQLLEYAAIFESELSSINICRFVPASGAASRMFKAFYRYLEDGIQSREVKLFKEGLSHFSFFDEIKCVDETDFNCAIDKMINKVELAELPKALIPFHKYRDETRSAFEEQLVEAAMVLSGAEKVKVHFTITQEHQKKFEALLKNKVKNYNARFSTTFDISFSYQDPNTDTIAVGTNNELARSEDMSLIFRPGGHGALLNNLNKLDSDLVFIKNIDNIQPDHLKKENILYKKALAGYLISIKKEIHDQLKSLESQDSDLSGVITLVVDKLSIKLPAAFDELNHTEKVQLLISKLNRPIRVCGMVKNSGEPGGGPFWVKNSADDITLQIVESSQIDLTKEDQNQIFGTSTHFNPVDIVCWLKDYRGTQFNLPDFTDPDTSFISEKTLNGQTLKVLEHPGLWNGAMADWITVFLEVPISTFSPVKTIVDLLRKEHQPN